jgi:hypothetical protein
MSEPIRTGEPSLNGREAVVDTTGSTAPASVGPGHAANAGFSTGGAAPDIGPEPEPAVGRPRPIERPPDDNLDPGRGSRPVDDTARTERISRVDWNPIMRGAMITLLILMGLLFLAFLLNGMGMIRLPEVGEAPVPTRELILGEAGEAPPVLGGPAGGAPQQPAGAEIPPPGPPPGPPPAVGERFAGFYAARGGELILGRPLSEVMLVNGREVQWFERARVEHWPEHAGTPYEIQLGRLGAEYTAERDFPGQSYFVSRPDLRYFPETGHAVGGGFLRFYDANGGLAAFGLPISEEFDEVLPDGRTYRVQYFERARMELHPEHAGTPYEVLLGLLGTALYQNEARPATVQPIPTPVP